MGQNIKTNDIYNIGNTNDLEGNHLMKNRPSAYSLLNEIYYRWWGLKDTRTSLSTGRGVKGHFKIGIIYNTRAGNIKNKHLPPNGYN